MSALKESTVRVILAPLWYRKESQPQYVGLEAAGRVDTGLLRPLLLERETGHMSLGRIAPPRHSLFRSVFRGGVADRRGFKFGGVPIKFGCFVEVTLGFFRFSLNSADVEEYSKEVGGSMEGFW